ncbi:MAG: hypothetical protein HY273_04185 [Gammaproteobacteria bacterium]|nr:hypothetical protein [Gammaproteobacteria bacterium]
MQTEVQYANGTFVSPNAEKLEHITEGCFVRVEANGSCFWAEIIERKGDGRYCGLIRHELATSECGTKALGFKKADFHAKHIVALGCDVFCSC